MPVRAPKGRQNASADPSRPSVNGTYQEQFRHGPKAEVAFCLSHGPLLFREHFPEACRVRSITYVSLCRSIGIGRQKALELDLL